MIREELLNADQRLADLSNQLKSKEAELQGAYKLLASYQDYLKLKIDDLEQKKQESSNLITKLDKERKSMIVECQE